MEKSKFNLGVAIVGVILIILIAVTFLTHFDDEYEVEPQEENSEGSVSYALYRAIDDIKYVEPGKSAYFNLVDSKVDELKIRDYALEDGSMLAFKLRFSISSESNISVYIVPNYEQYEHLGSSSFISYEECFGLVNECYISYYAGMIIVNHGKERAKIYRRLQVYEPIQ